MANPSQAAAANESATGAYRPEESAAELVRVLDGYLADLQAGRAPDRAQLLAAHPSLAAQLEQCLAGIEFIHHAAQPAPGTPNLLGDFRIVREIGRGGMGVVYEAEQVSLKRKVALKVLRFGAVADAEVMQRFKREAETVARLHHTNIVPVFAVGCEHGVHYYAMQFIEGTSLAAVIDEHAHERRPVSPADLAGWGLQAAEALAHAHQRGVIHRDIKPSNLLLDPEGVVWLTDFGLARRVDEVTLTVTGVLLGTPRYMSPEQAAALKKPVDHRTDIYSLGATLYELATGRPVFEAETPHAVITQILSAEPVRPCRLQPGLPRDLETVILKCLAKEPERRYPTAQALAGDLRAFLDGRPIQARRASLRERAARWVKKHRRSTAVAAVAAAVSLLLAVGSLTGWRQYREAQLGRLTLTTKGPQLLAEVLDANDNLVVPAFTVPTPEPVALPAGSYRLRLSATGLLSETWQLDIEKGQSSSVEVGLGEQVLWSAQHESSAQEVAEVRTLDGRADVIVYSQQQRRFRRLDGRTGKPVWPADLVLNAASMPPGSGASPEEWANLGGSALFDPCLAADTPDLDGDNVGDLLWVPRNSASLLAISGRDGKPLWWFRARPQFPPRVDAGKTRFRPGSYGVGTVVGQPVVVAGDRGRVSALVAVFTSRGEQFEAERPAPPGVTEPQTWVEAVSRTGQSLWRYPLDKGWLDLRYLFNSKGTESPDYHQIGQPQVVKLDGRPVVVFVADHMLLGLDAETGMEVWPPHDLGFRPLKAPQLADLAEDGQPAAVFLRPKDEGEELYNRTVFLSALSLKMRTTVWEMPFPLTTSRGDLRYSEVQPYRVADLGGRPAVVVALGKDQLVRDVLNARYSWSGIAVLDGATGRPRWQRRLWFRGHSPPPPVNRFLLGPDLDGDGFGELFVAWTDWDSQAQRSVLTVRALSGRDGHTLWSWRQAMPGTMPDSSGPLQWWQTGKDNWPQLLVPIANGPGGQPMTFILSAGSGRLAGVLPGVYDPRVADFDGDGIPDLMYRVAPQGIARLLVVRGKPPEPWRRFGDWQPVGDLDGDGFPDFIDSRNRRVVARSGRDGHRLWQAGVRVQERDPILVIPPPRGDPSGDGVPGLVAVEQDQWGKQKLTALSGKDGARLWAAESPAFDSSSGGSNSWGRYHYPFLDWCRPGGDSPTGVLVASVHDQRGALTLYSGRDGKLLWQIPFLMGSLQPGQFRDRRGWADLNGDGIPDPVLCVPWLTDSPLRERAAVQAFNGRDGRPLWPAPPVVANTQDLLLSPRPVVGDLDGDGVPEVVVAVRRDPDPQRGDAEVVVLDSRDGRRKWAWPWAVEVSHFPDILPPLLVNLDGDGRRTVCLGVWEKGKPQVVLLSGDGRVRRRIPLAPDKDLVPDGWNAGDLRGDGKEELLVITDGKLWAHDGGEQPLWQWDLPTRSAKVVEIQSASPGQPATVVVWVGRSVYGLSGATGLPRWRCEIQASDDYTPAADGSLHLLPVQDSPGRPWVLFRWPRGTRMELGTVCRQAWPTDDAGRYQAPVPAPLTYLTMDDPGWPRPLPWANPVPYALFSRPDLIQILLGVLFAGLLGRAAWKRRWRQIGLLLTGFLAASALMAGADLWDDRRYMDPEEYYLWEGWYWIGLWGAELVVVVWLLVGALGLARRWGRRLFTRKAEPAGG